MCIYHMFNCLLTLFPVDTLRIDLQPHKFERVYSNLYRSHHCRRHSLFVDDFVILLSHSSFCTYTDFLPVYYQACKGASPTRSGVDFFGIALVLGPALLATGASIAITKKYRVQLWLAWVVTIASMGALSTLQADTPIAAGVGYPVLLGISSGMIYCATYFPVLAPLPIEENAHALAFFAFCRSFAGVRTLSLPDPSRSAHTDILYVGLGHHYRYDSVTNAARRSSPVQFPLHWGLW
jgi:hypothetical protein